MIARWRIEFVLLAATWGSSFLFIKVLDRHWSPLWVALGRISLGALTLNALMLWRGERLAFDRRLWRHLFVTAALFNAIPFTLYAYGERHVSSVLAGLWNGTTPLWVLVVALAAFPEEHPTRARGLGLALGFIGVVMLLGPWRGLASGQLTGQLACAGAAACYGLAFLYTRRHLAGRADSGVALAAAQLLCATILLALFTPFARLPSTHIGLDALGSILALGMLGSGIAYVLNFSIVRAAGATVASTVTYLVPVFATLLGVTVLGERVTWNQPAGAAVLLLGIAVSQGQLRVADGRDGAAARSEPQHQSRRR